MRLIDADALGIGRCSKDILPAAYCAGWNGAVGLIEQAPTIDAVPVVRCGKCRWWCSKAGDPPTCMHEFNGLPYSTATDFCSYGERKEGEGDK